MSKKIPLRDILSGSKRNSILKHNQVKRTLIPFLILVFLMAPLLSIQPVAATPAIFSLTSNTQTLVAGTNNQVTFTITNLGDTTASQIFISLSLPSSAAGGALMILNGSDGKWYIDSLSSYDYYTISANIYVSPSAAGGTYQLTFALSYQSFGPKTDTRTIGVGVPALNVTGASLSASISPYELVFGQNNILTLTLKNVGDADAMSVTASLVMPGVATGSSPLSLINSDGRWTYDTIKLNDEVSIPLTIYASPSSAGQTYQATLTLTYSDYIRAKTETRYLTLSVPFNTSPAVNFEMGFAPQDLKAGEVNTLNITIANKGDSDATYVQAVLTLPVSGVSGVPMVLQNSDGRWLFDTIKAGDTVNLQANVYVSPSSSGTAYQASLSLTYYDSLNRAKQDVRYFGLNVPAIYAPTAVIDIRMSKTELKSGENNYMNLTVKNIGDGPAESLTVQLTLPGAQAGSSSVILVGSDGIWSFGRLEPGQEQVVPLALFVNPNVSGSVISITVTSAYTDMGYKPEQKINYLGMIVRGSVNLVILGTSTFPTTVTPGQPFSLTINFINLGTATAQSVLLTPSGTGTIRPTSSDNIFLGDLAVNVPSSFTISYSTAVGVTSGRYNVTLGYTYKDSLGGTFANTLNVPFTLTIGANATGGGQGGQGTGGQGRFGLFGTPLPLIVTIIIVAVIAVAVILYIRRRRSGAAQ
jgi:hypothetical protein